MKRGADWYKRDPIAFLDGVQGLGPELIGAYAVILDLLYARAGESRRDDRHLAGLLGCSLRKAATLTDALIEAGKITVHDGFIVNSRVENDVKQWRELCETRATHGRTGGEKSAEVRKNNALAEANASSKIQADKNREEKKESPPTPPPGGKRGRSMKNGQVPYTANFERFWSAYPRKDAKAAAFEAFQRFDADTREAMVIAAPLFAAQMRREERPPGKVPHGSTWINQRRFDDFVEWENEGEAEDGSRENRADGRHSAGGRGDNPGDGGVGCMGGAQAGERYPAGADAAARADARAVLGPELLAAGALRTRGGLARGESVSLSAGLGLSDKGQAGDHRGHPAGAQAGPRPCPEMVH